MNGDDVRATALEVLAQIAPEAAGLDLVGDAPLRDQVDLDSMDALNLLIGIGERLGVDLSQEEALHTATLDDLVETFVAGAARAGR
jgi:acyl carrier protein